MSNKQERQHQAGPVLRLRPTVPTELIRHRPKKKQPDGPWIAHPEYIDEEFHVHFRPSNHGPDITMSNYRDLWKADQVEVVKQLKKHNIEDLEIGAVIVAPHSVDMQKMQGIADSEIASAIEDYYMGHPLYLTPGTFHAPSYIDRYGADWGMNARGIYYRHHYSPGWVTADHSLWLPCLEDVDWTHHTEKERRTRAERFLKHILDNEKWNKSEYAWEADAWTDVFGLMRDDPLLAVDKREYNTIRQKRHPVTCLLTEESQFIKRIPDATFGLTTFKPQDYQSSLAEWDLDHGRLEALSFHRHCNLRSDPRWTETSLVFPFAAYEAKGWNGDAREARRQACSAGAAYLDILDRLIQRPGMEGDRNNSYQTEQSRNSQVFVYTSFGAHWHILVGYKRRRLKREHAGSKGMSEYVYLFQRIWSGRVTTERKAWELLSLVDQIHIWGVTIFRDFVIQHLRPWHEFAKKCYVNDVDYMVSFEGVGMKIVNDNLVFRMPPPCNQLPEWTKHLADNARQKLKEKLVWQLQYALAKYRPEVRIRSDDFPEMCRCGVEECGSLGPPGYPLASKEEVKTHLHEIHEEDDTAINDLIRNWGAGDGSLQTPELVPWSVTSGQLPSAGQKRQLEDITDDEIENRSVSKKNKKI